LALRFCNRESLDSSVYKGDRNEGKRERRQKHQEKGRRSKEEKMSGRGIR